MRAVLVDPGAPGHLKLTEGAEPVPRSDQAVVEVKAISLNLGEVKRARRSEAGLQLGWDLAGVVAEPAADGSGPPAGTRVVGIVLAGAWAERAAVKTSWMAPLPDDVSFADAATLPVAGMTALYALEQGGQLLGRRVLVTGASGGVGLFGIQLARLSGATVTALIRQAKYADMVAEAGAAHVVVGERAQGAAAHGPFHCTLESVGGQVLADAMKLVAGGGVLVNYGVSAGEQATIEVGDFFRAGRSRYYGLYLFTEFGRRPARDGLGVLVDLLAAGRLDGHIAAEGGLDELGDLAERLFNREIAGKAVIQVG
ncbi:MAG: zinc-binding dehydrogenase [Alphaproteobacteria bacterium]|jgi:NADPH:quinone reductase-like Zn-dependent oxidoreductase|nr:zinc-binding dehydrogenase [Alphaproteobacteria bacterium]